MDKLILTAGPSITEKEIAYVLDAVQNGWNSNFDGYLKKFEKALADYTGVKHVLAVTHGTHALHLALLTAGINSNDEVILPDLGFIAAANAVRYVGAIPVFVDVDPKTWCLDVEKIEAAISQKTRAIMPVWMYGSAPAMDQLTEVASNHNLWVIEDSCPALGSFYKGRSAGSWGQFGAFSFQGAKVATIGEGGALLINDDGLYEKARILYDQCKDPKKQFWHIAVGYKYRMSNLQAALGLAQVERIEELVARKRNIFNWYHERLKDVDCLFMNYEAPSNRIQFWMSSIILKEGVSLSRDDLRKKLREFNIDTRPFFYPLTSMPMYHYNSYREEGKTDNPISYWLGHYGINLPSGVCLDEDTVDYICAAIKSLL